MPGKYLDKSTAQGRFVLDIRLDSLFTEYNRIGNKLLYENVETGKKHSFDNPEYTRKSILTPEHYLSHNPEQIALTHQSPHGIIYRKSNESGARLRINSIVIDPRQICTIGQNPFERYFSKIGKLIAKNPQLILSIEAISEGEKGYRCTYITPSGDSLKVTLSEANSYLPVHLHSTSADGNYDETVEWSYQDVDGIKVPEHYHRKLLIN